MNRFWLPIIILAFITSCSHQVKAPPRYEYAFQPGKTALFRDGYAVAPKKAPAAVHQMTAAGNHLKGYPYRYGGGHALLEDSGYDCSGATSYLLRKAGLIDGCLTSEAFMNYGKPGAGKWVTIYAKSGHVFIVVAGLRFDTGGTRQGDGPQWKPTSRTTKGFVLRHPRGL